MKRIISGMTYNTDTATRLATSDWDDDMGSISATLYQTKGGAYFDVQEITQEIWNEVEGRHDEQTSFTFNPMSAEEAHKWIMTDHTEILHNPFDDPPEAVAESEMGATIYIRVPTSLKTRVDAAAQRANLSVNAWAMRCIEGCLSA